MPEPSAKVVPLHAPVPPQDLHAEDSVLGAMLQSEKAVGECSELLADQDFYSLKNGVVFAAIVGMYGRGEPADPVTVADQLAKDGTLEKVGGRGRVNELAVLMPATAHAAHYAGIVKEQAKLRGVLAVGQDAARGALAREGTADELVDRAEQQLLQLVQVGGGELATLKEPMLTAFGEALAARATGGLAGLPSGLPSLDRVTDGFFPGNLILAAARPSMGKSALAYTIAADVCYRQGLPIALFTLEVSTKGVANRMLSMEANVELRRFKGGRFDSADEGRLVAAGNRIAPLPFYTDATAGTVAEIRSKARRLKMLEPNLALIIVDYVQLIAGAGRVENRTQEVTQISRALKRLAVDLDVPVLALSQLSRAVEQRSDKRPILSDLRESGALEQDADLVMLLYRDEYYDEESDQQGLAEVHLAKHRDGPTDHLTFAFLKRTAKFTELHA